jgi:hypothetical protein
MKQEIHNLSYIYSNLENAILELRRFEKPLEPLLTIPMNQLRDARRRVDKLLDEAKMKGEQ